MNFAPEVQVDHSGVHRGSCFAPNCACAQFVASGMAPMQRARCGGCRHMSTIHTDLSAGAMEVDFGAVHAESCGAFGCRCTKFRPVDTRLPRCICGHLLPAHDRFNHVRLVLKPVRIANGRGNLLVWKLAVLGPACSGKTELLNALRDDPFVENEPGKEVDRVPRIVVDSLEIGGVPLGVLGTQSVTLAVTRARTDSLLDVCKDLVFSEPFPVLITIPNSEESPEGWVRGILELMSTCADFLSFSELYKPTIALVATKTDLAPGRNLERWEQEWQALREQFQHLFEFHVPILEVSAKERRGLSQVTDFIRENLAANPILVEPVELSLVNMVSRLRDIPNLGKFLDVDLLRRVASDCGVSKVDLEEGLFHRNHVMSRRLSRWNVSTTLPNLLDFYLLDLPWLSRLISVLLNPAAPTQFLEPTDMRNLWHSCGAWEREMPEAEDEMTLKMVVEALESVNVLLRFQGQDLPTTAEELHVFGNDWRPDMQPRFLVPFLLGTTPPDFVASCLQDVLALPQLRFSVASLSPGQGDAGTGSFFSGGRACEFMAFVSRLAPIVPLDQHSFLLRAGETLFLGTLHGDILSASAVQLSPIRDPLPPELDAAIPFVPAQQVGALPVSPPARGGQEEGDLAAPFNAEFRHSVVLCQSPAEVMTLSMLLDSFILSIDPNATLSILAEVRCPGCHVEGPSDVHYFAMEHLLEVEEDAHVQCPQCDTTYEKSFLRGVALQDAELVERIHRQSSTILTLRGEVQNMRATLHRNARLAYI